jgi:hypothetical protein
VALELSPFGILQVARSTAPVGGEVGYAPGCQWFVPSATSGIGAVYQNIGTNLAATWIEADASSGGGFQWGSALSSTGYMRTTGNVYVDVRAAAGISPSATGAYKILSAVLVPANSLSSVGRGFKVTVWGAWANNGNTKQIQVVLGATNTVMPALDGTVTVTGGTVIGDSGAVTTAAGNWILECMLIKTGAPSANTQGSMTTRMQNTATPVALGAWTDQTFVQTNPLLLAVTGNATTTATDIVYQGTIVQAFN